MNDREREAYHVGLYDLPGNYDGRIWPTTGEQMWWLRGRRERAENLERQEQSTDPTRIGSRHTSFSEFMGQLATGLGAVGGMAGFIIGFGWKSGSLILNIVLFTLLGIAVGAAGPLLIRFLILQIGRLFSRNRPSR